MKKNYQNPISQSFDKENTRLNVLNESNNDHQSILYNQINQSYTFQNNINKLRGGGNSQPNPQIQQNRNLNDIFDEQDIFQYLKYHTILLQRILGNQINQNGRDQLEKVVQWINSKGIINQLFNQCRLDERKIAIVMASIDILLSCVINTPIQLSYNLLQFTQNLFQILYYQDKVIKSNIIKNLHIFSDNLQLINQKYQQQKGLEILFNYQFCLIKDVVDHIQDRKAYNLQKCIFEQNTYLKQNDANNTLIQDAKKFLQSDNPRQLDIFYFFQQSKLTIIRKLLNQQQIIEIQQIINYLCKVYQLCIQNNQNWRVHLGFLQMLLELISQKNSFLEDLQKFEGDDITNIMFNELQNQLIEFQIEDNINIWEHYIKSKWDSTIKCYLAFSFMTIKKSQIAKNVESACQKFIDLFLNSDQDENTISVLKNEQLNVIEEAFEQNLKQNQQTYLYKIYGNTQIEKLQEDFINIDLKVQSNINNDDVKKQQQSNKSNYLFREDVDQGVKQEQIYIVNDFLWTENNNTDVLWIKGIAGSGKSYFLKRLQLFLLKHYHSHSKQKKWIPFLISLDALKKLNNNNIWSLILNADDMEFRDEFMGILSDDLENGLVNIVLLFDGLDEMKHQIQEVNLDISLFQKKLGKNVKIIITSRREVQIEKQFIGLQFQNLTEVEILKLDESQINEYLKQYCIENTRQYLYQIYNDFIDQEKNSKISRIMFNEYWQAYFFEEVKTLVEQTNNDKYEIIFTDTLINNFLSKQQKIFQNNNNPKGDLLKIQSSSKLMKIIKENQIFDLIQTIQILQVILQVLPNLNQNITNKLYRKNRFKCILLQLKNEQIKYFNELEQAKLFSEKDYVERLVVILEKNQFFDEFLVEKLDKNIMQISEVDFNLIKNAAKQTQLTKYQIYKLFVSKYYEIYIKKLKDSGFNNINESFTKELNKLQMFLAVQMIKHECLLLDTQQVQNIFQSYLNQNNLEDKKNLILLYSTFITKIQNGSFIFQNKSIQEYFVGKYILKLLKDFSRNFTGKSIEQGLEQSQFNQNEFNLSLLQFSQVINDIKPELLNYEDIKKILLKIIILSRNEVFIRAASNSILLLNFLGIELIGEDLSRIKLSKTNISGLNVYGSNLDESEFNEVKIDYCNFNNTSLQRVKWTQTPWNGVIVFRDQHQEKVSSILFSPNGQFLLSYGSSQVNIWELITQKIFKKIKYNQNLCYWRFSSDSTKFYLGTETFLQIYCIYGNDITLLITIPLQLGQLQLRNFPFTFYNKEEKLVYRRNSNFYSYNLKSKQQWNKSKIADNSIKLTSIKLISNDKILIGTKDREIKIWDGIIKNISKTITKKDHQSEIVSLSEETFDLKINQQEIFDKKRQISLLISASEDQVIVWLNDHGYGYKQVKALHSQTINGQLPRYSIFNKKHLVYIINEYIVLYDLNQINKLEEDITFCDSNCIAFINYEWEQFRLLFIAKENCIEVYEYLNICIGEIPLNQCQPLSMDIITHNLMITYNKDNTIRFWSICSYYQNEEQKFVSNNMDPFRKQNPFSRSRVLQRSIKGFVQNLKQSYKYNENEGTCEVAVQENEKQINIYKVQIFENQIKYHLIKLYEFQEDQKIGCYALCNYGKKICYCVDNIITIKDLQNDDQTLLEQIQEKDIYLIMFSEKEQYLASCSNDNSIVIYRFCVDKKQKFYMIKNKKCLDLFFVKEDDNVLVIQTQTSIIWYKIIWNIDSQQLLVQVFKYHDFEYGVQNGIFDQQMSIVYLIPQQNYNYINLQQVQKEYLAVKQGENIILKPLIVGDQAKVVIFNEQNKKIEFVNEEYIIFSEESSNILEIKNVSDMQVIRKLEYCAFAIREREYLIIAVETIKDIQVIHILPEQIFTTETIKKQIQGKLHHFTLSNSGYFLASTYNQEITIYYITKGPQIIQISKLFIEIEIKDIQISDNQQIIIQSQDGLYQYKLNVEEESIYSIDNYFGNNQLVQNNQSYKIEILIQGNQFIENYDYKDTKLNHNDKLIALKIYDKIYFTSLQRPQLQLILEAKLFCTSIDSKYFAISNDNQIKYYDWQDNIKNIYNFDYKQDLLYLRFLQNPNQILAISSKDIQIIQCQENQIKKIRDGLYQYKLNLEEESIYSIDNYFGNNQLVQNNQSVKIEFQVNQLLEYYNYKDTILNHNDKLIALKIDDLIYFTSLQRPQLQLQLEAKFFCTSIDSKYFAISNNNQIKYYDWQDNIKNIYNFDYKQDLFDLRFLQNPNQILAISSNDIQIIQCQENQIKKIKGRQYASTRASSNLDIAKIEKSIIQISKPEINIELYNPEDYDFNAYNPQFTSDGQYIIYEQNKKVIFQSLFNRHSKYSPEKLEGQYNVSVLPESNYLISFNQQESPLQAYQNCGYRKLEYYLNCWDVSDLSNVENLFTIPILQHQTKKISNKQWFISEIQNNILCLYDIKEFQQGIYDTILHNNNQKIHYSGICPNETKYYTVSTEDWSITIWMMKSCIPLKQFKGHQYQIFFIGFSEDEKYMISRDTDQIIVWNLENEDKLIIKDPNIENQRFLFYCSNFSTFGWNKFNKCDFVKLHHSIGITIQSQGQLFIYDLKDFKSYELFYKLIVHRQEIKSFRHYVYSNGSKIALYQKQQDEKFDKIYILDVKSKQIIDTNNLQRDEIFYGYHNIDKYIKIKIDKEHEFYGLNQKNGYIFVCYKDSNLLSLYKVEDFVNEHGQPIKEVFIHLKIDLNDYNSSFIHLCQVGPKYITYYYNSQLRVIDLERYEKQLKIIKLDKSQEFLNIYKQDYILLKNREEQTLNIYNLRNGQNNKVIDRNIDKMIVAFKNNGEQLALGWDDGSISIYYIYTQVQYDFSIKNKQAIKHILYTQDDKILISCSQDNVISFWEYQYKKEKLIQSIQIDQNIESIVVSPNNLDIALELSGGLIQIITIDKQKCWNQNQKYFGFYKSYPQLRQFLTQNCLVKNSIIQDQNGNSLVHHLGEKMKQEFEAQKIQDEQQY
ncbi:unnamed protein product [Paramecium pentaurelia]|uniref:NACHT domain-containing protein n=1 Tax=Paramecium pentaurelia TaxID=43138 RepID=A0A8S1V8H2_9CILI|nr:unnamed protein product [Paramecium pentaurelia]